MIAFILQTQTTKNISLTGPLIKCSNALLARLQEPFFSQKNKNKNISVCSVSLSVPPELFLTINTSIGTVIIHKPTTPTFTLQPEIPMNL